MIPLFFAKAKDGMIEWNNKNAVFLYLVKLEGKEISVIIETYKGKRTLDQNALYWHYLTIISSETGHTENELHEIFKRLYLPPQFLKYKGREIKIPGSTAKLNKVQFGEYLDRICADTDVPIPSESSI